MLEKLLLPSSSSSPGQRDATSQNGCFSSHLSFTTPTKTTMGGLLVGPTSDTFQRFFIPSVCVLITFLGYTSQWLFNTAENLEPGPMTKRETTIFNILLACVWSTYYKACTVPPGRYNFPPPSPTPKEKDHQQQPTDTPSSSSFSTHLPTNSDTPSSAPPPTIHLPTRWCNKCSAPKPLRAHHCRTCGHCIPKMDHHCPWTGQCVSLQTFPHFLRFLLYTNLALTYLHVSLLYPRLHTIFLSDVPAYLGPSVPAITHLVLLGLIGLATSLLLLVMLVTSTRSWVLNQTMIEGWESERHDAVLARARKSGGYWDPGNSRAGDTPATRIARVEFPYDLSFFQNMAETMGTRNVLAWLDPFVGCGPVVAPYPGSTKSTDRTGWEYEENGFNDRAGMWPPPDPDKLRRGVPARNNVEWREKERAEIEALEGRWKDPGAEVAAFKGRQEMDLRRRRGEMVEEVEELGYEYVDSGSGGGYEDEEDDDDDDDGVYGKYAEDDEDVEAPLAHWSESKTVYEQGMDGEPGWTNAEGDRLRDYGVDEDAEGDDDEDIPLGELLRRRKTYQGGEQ